MPLAVMTYTGAVGSRAGAGELVGSADATGLANALTPSQTSPNATSPRAATSKQRCRILDPILGFIIALPPESPDRPGHGLGERQSSSRVRPGEPRQAEAAWPPAVSEVSSSGCPVRSRARWRAALARFPQVAMSHQRLRLVRDES